MNLYCVEYNGLFGFFKPYNAVRDGETYSLTYLPTSVLDGIVKEYCLAHKIARHKLTFYGMTTESDFRGGRFFANQKRPQPQVRHSLKDVTLILGFDNKEDADEMLKRTIHAGQSEYMLFPMKSFEVSEQEFDEFKGVETFETNENDDDALFCGFNRQRNGEKMFIKISRKEWK